MLNNHLLLGMGRKILKNLIMLPRLLLTRCDDSSLKLSYPVPYEKATFSVVIVVVEM